MAKAPAAEAPMRRAGRSRRMMSEGKEESLIDRTPAPRTRAGLAHDLAALGVAPGMTVIVHASLGRLGLVVGGAPIVIRALMDALGPDGTLVMPTFSGGLTDPATWRDPAVPADWHAFIRANMPPFDAARTPTRLMGQILWVGGGHDRNFWPPLAGRRPGHGRRKMRRMPIERDGLVTWEEFPETDDDRGRLFPLIGTDYDRTGAVRIGFVGSAESRLM